jgi:hypothetical protein
VSRMEQFAAYRGGCSAAAAPIRFVECGSIITRVLSV